MTRFYVILDNRSLAMTNLKLVPAPQPGVELELPEPSDHDFFGTVERVAPYLVLVYVSDSDRNRSGPEKQDRDISGVLL